MCIAIITCSASCIQPFGEFLRPSIPQVCSWDVCVLVFYQGVVHLALWRHDGNANI